MPAGLGSHADIVLPRGAVCQTCNNHLGRQVDEALVHLLEVQLIRGFHRVPDRRGRRIEAVSLKNGTIVFPDDSALEIIVHGESDVVEAGGTVTVTAVANRKRSGDHWRRAVRAIMKTGLCLICYAHGQAVALQSEWDRLRRIIAGEPYHGYFLAGQFDIFATPHLKASLLTTVPGMTLGAQLCFGGLDLVVDLEPKPVNDQIRAWAMRGNYRISEIAPRSI